METKRDFYKMIADRRKNIKKEGVSNCIGTALYLTGEIEEDFYLKHAYNNKIHSLEVSEIPKLGYFLSWEDPDEKMEHVGVITNLNPLSIAHREKYKGNFIQNQEVSELSKFDVSYLRKVFRVPSKLKKILEKQGKKFSPLEAELNYMELLN